MAAARTRPTAWPDPGLRPASLLRAPLRRRLDDRDSARGWGRARPSAPLLRHQARALSRSVAHARAHALEPRPAAERWPRSRGRDLRKRRAVARDAAPQPRDLAGCD